MLCLLTNSDYARAKEKMVQELSLKNMATVTVLDGDPKYVYPNMTIPLFQQH